jgi:glyoxylase I family protein
MADQPISIGRMDHLALPTTDAARGERFYRDLLGFRTVPRPSFSFDGRWLMHDGVGVMIHLIHSADFQPRTAPINTMNGHFALQCTEIDSAREKLIQHGIEFVERKLPDYGYRQIFFRDPDGNIIELGEWPHIQNNQQQE